MAGKEDPSTRLDKYVSTYFPDFSVTDHSNELSTALRNFAMYPTVIPADYEKYLARRNEMIERMIPLGKTLVESGQDPGSLLELARFTMNLFPREVSPTTIEYIIEQLNVGLTAK